MTRPVEGNLEKFLLTEDSIVFHFQPYEVAPYSAGIVEVSIAFEELGLNIN